MANRRVTFPRNKRSRLPHRFALALMAAVMSIARPTTAQVPAHRVVQTRDISYGVVRRLNVRVSLPRHYSKQQIEAIARAVVRQTTAQQQVNAISIMFFGPGTATDGAWDVASVDWAPNGRWGDAGNVSAGDYRTFRYSIEYRPPAAPERSGGTALTLSPKRGLLGAPLPNGASLLNRTRGDPATGRDPSERYRVDASAAAIAAFYLAQMPKFGWLKDGTSTETALFFRKGRLMIGVLMNSKGQTFTLMGS
jgi:hypothetical protein